LQARLSWLFWVELSVAGILHTAMGRKHDSWSWLDCDHGSGICHLDTRTHPTPVPCVWWREGAIQLVLQRGDESLLSFVFFTAAIVVLVANLTG